MADCFNRNGGEARVGRFQNPVHAWIHCGHSGWIQDFNGGSEGEGVIVQRDYDGIAFWIRGGNWNLFRNDGYASSNLCWPVSDEQYATSRYGSEGTYQHFEHGSLHYSNFHGTHYILGDIHRRFEELGGTNSPLGFPTINTSTAGTSPYETGGSYQRFEGGVMHASRHGARITWNGAIKDYYDAQGGTNGPLGFPVDRDEEDAGTSPFGTTGRAASFEGGQMHSSRHGAFRTYGPILARFSQLSGSGSVLGFPVSHLRASDPSPSGTTGEEQFFEGGGVYHSRFGTFSLTGPIFARYNGTHDTNSTFGFPTSNDELSATSGRSGHSGRMATFENGRIYHVPAISNARAFGVEPPLMLTYYAAGGHSGPYGFPTDDQKKDAEGQWYQTFEGGVIPATLTVTSPNGGETWAAGTTQTIRWGHTGVAGNVKIEYSTNGGESWQTIHGSITNDESETWQVPNTLSTQARVRISSIALPGLSDASNGSFTIQPPLPAPPSGLTATAPSSTAVNLIWVDNSGNEDGFLLERKTGSGNFGHLTTRQANITTYTDSTVAPETTYTYRIRAGNPSGVSDYSTSSPVTTPPVTSLRLQSPNGGEAWQVGTSRDVTWTSAHLSGNVRLEYSINGGSSWTIFSAETANDGSETWTVPNTPTSQARVRVISLTDTAILDQSDASFTISAAPASTFTLQSATAAPGTTVGLPLIYQANGAQSIAAGFDLAFDSSRLAFVEVVKGAVPAGVVVVTHAVSAGRVRVAMYNPSGGTPWASGTVATVRFGVAAGLQSGSSTNIRLLTPAAGETEQIQTTDTSGIITYAPATPAVLTIDRSGDFNNNGVVDVGDIQILVNVFLGKPGFPAEPRHDLNGNGGVDIGDVQAEVNLFLGRSSQVTASAGNSSSLLLATGSASFALQNGAVVPGASVTLPLMLAAKGAQISAIGFDVVFDPAKLNLLEIARGAVPSGVVVVSNSLSPGRVRIAMYDPSGGTAWSSGKVADLRLQAAGGFAGSTTVYLNLPVNGSSATGVQTTDLSGNASNTSATAATVTLAYSGGKLSAPSRIAFGRARRGKSADRTLTIRNRSRTQDLIVSVGSAASPFGIVRGGGSITIRRNQSATIRLRFSPTAAGAQVATLILTSSDSARPTHTVTLSGRGM